ncbi:MAG: hypothetical protein CMI53_02015 [Parcubacteria group bacterium]|nr:hypothetical protein [Parcubacteria group bacterium]|tara:strand:- start:4775 stop:5101 length:327 start_codon:yes stop_codon:yes gene_type:complete
MPDPQVLYFIGFLILYAVAIRVFFGKQFPKYFCDGSKRIDIGERPYEYNVEIRQNRDGHESWIFSHTIKGWTKALEHMTNENKHHERIKKALKRATVNKTEQLFGLFL